MQIEFVAAGAAVGEKSALALVVFEGEVLAGAADCAAIDSSVWDDRNGRDPRLKEIRVVGRTRDWPAPPFAVSRAIDAEMRRAIAASLTRSAPVGLEAIVPADDADYDLIRRGMALARDVAW